MRLIEEQDRPLIEESLANDPYHQNTTADFFYEVGTATRMYMDQEGPVLVLRGTPSLRLDVQFMNNEDTVRNMNCMMVYFERLVADAHASGFKEVTFQTNNPGLKRFVIKRLGFYELEGEMRRSI